MYRDCLIGCHLFTILVYVMDGFSDVFIQVVYIHASWIIWTIRICWIYRSIWCNWMVWIDIHVRWIVSYCFFKIVSLTITINFRNRLLIGEHTVNYWRIYRWIILVSFPWIVANRCRTILFKVHMTFPRVMHRNRPIWSYLFAILVYVMDSLRKILI